MIAPQPIKQVAVVAIDEKRQSVRFHATEEALEKVRDAHVGEVIPNLAPPSYELIVSPLFGFDQVVDWLREIEEESRGPF